MTAQSPAAKLEAKANREQSKLMRVHDELQRVIMTVKNSDLPGDVKLRLYHALANENDLINNEQNRIAGLRKAAEISRSRQWVTSGDK
jgi:hypothetical protein